MTLSHDEANARLLDLVYGEGPADARAALEAHVATCAACTADLAAFGATRARLRAALEDAPPPSRVHARLLEAATQAAAPVALAAAAAVAPAAAPLVRAVAPPRAPSFWDKLRHKWTLPTFATVGAVAIVVIASKVFLEPDKTMERGREVATGAAAPPADEQAPEAAKVAQPSVAAAPSHELLPAPHAFGPGGTAEMLNRVRGGTHPGLLGSATLAQRLAHHAGHPAAPSGVDDLDSLGGMGSGRVAAAPAAPLLPKTAHDELLERAIGNNRAPANAPRPARRADTEGAAPPVAANDFAAPPSGWKGGAAAGGAATGAATTPPAMPAPAAPRPMAASAARAKRDEAADLDGALAARAAPTSNAAPSPRAAAIAEEEAEQAPAPIAKKKSPSSSSSSSSPPPPASATPREKDAEEATDKAADKKEAKSEDVTSREALARRADKLYAARNWSAAIAAYRELLRRYPDADVTPRWRARMAEAQAALGDEAPAVKSAAKASAVGKTSKKVLLDAEPAKE